jgi:tRNA A-37 threonylcarbamoyl transferase component Bud32
VEALSGGVACTVLRLHAKRGPLVIKQALERFRVTETWLVDPGRNLLEARFQKLAREVLGPAHVPEVLDIDPENFTFTMASAPLPARNWKMMMLDGDVRPALGRQCAQLLAKLQSITPSDPRLPPEIHDPRFFRQQRLEPYFEFTAKKHPDVAQALTALGKVLVTRRQVAHGDYTPKNFLVVDDTLVLLDFEVVHIGMREFDMASLVNHLTLKMVHLPAHRAALRQTVEQFLEEWLFTVTPPPGGWWLNCLGALMLARVDGKSPVDYLTASETSLVRTAARQLLCNEYASLDELYAGMFPP